MIKTQDLPLIDKVPFKINPVVKQNPPASTCVIILDTETVNSQGFPRGSICQLAAAHEFENFKVSKSKKEKNVTKLNYLFIGTTH